MDNENKRRHGIAKRVIGTTGLIVFKCVTICIAMPAIGAYIAIENLINFLDPPDSYSR